MAWSCFSDTREDEDEFFDSREVISPVSVSSPVYRRAPGTTTGCATMRPCLRSGPATRATSMSAA
ncbi:hypothetical protein ABZP36_002365 [Zizania latifolia]